MQAKFETFMANIRAWALCGSDSSPRYRVPSGLVGGAIYVHASTNSDLDAELMLITKTGETRVAQHAFAAMRHEVIKFSVDNPQEIIISRVGSPNQPPVFIVWVDYLVGERAYDAQEIFSEG